MRKSLLVFFALATTFSSFANKKKDGIQTEPLFQLAAAPVYSSIDLNRYINSNSYRGLHLRLVTHMGGVFFISTEYSKFHVHTAPCAWDDIHAKKLDLNGQVSFRTRNHLTNIYALMGVDRHLWLGRRTGFTDLDPLSSGIPEGTYVSVKKWGLNFGCGFTQTLYENIGIFGDYRFCFARSENFEKVAIMDVMATFGINISIPHFEKGNGKKTFGIGKKLYKWTNKGGQ